MGYFMANFYYDDDGTISCNVLTADGEISDNLADAGVFLSKKEAELWLHKLDLKEDFYLQFAKPE